MFKYKYTFLYWNYDRFKPFAVKETVVADSMDLAILEIELLIFDKWLENKNWCRGLYPEITLIQRI